MNKKIMASSRKIKSSTRFLVTVFITIVLLLGIFVPASIAGAANGTSYVGSDDNSLYAIGEGAPPLPRVTLVAPSSGCQGQTLNVTITGAYFTWASAVSFGAGITVNSFTVHSDTQITAGITIAGDATQGSRNVSVTTAGGTETLTARFWVTNVVPPTPTVTSVVPGFGYQGQTLNVTVIGANFTWATSVDFETGVTVNSFSINTNTHITACITVADSATMGMRNVSVTTAGGISTLTAGFTVTAPCTFGGAVTIDDVTAPPGTVVDVYVAAETTPRGTTTTTAVGFYDVVVSGTDTDIGQPVTFMVDGLLAVTTPPVPLFVHYIPQTVNLAATKAYAEIWNCPWGGVNLIAPYPFHGRPYLTVAVDPAEITVSAGAALWGIYYFDETTGEWLYFIPGFTGSTLTQLEPNEFYLVVVSDDLTTLTIPQ